MPSLDLLPGGDLPVRDALPGLLDALSRGNAVLVAPPGAGKTTLVPLALLDAPWRGDGRILVLEPTMFFRFDFLIVIGTDAGVFFKIFKT